MSLSVNIDVNKPFEVYLLDRPFLSAKGLFIKKNSLAGIFKKFSALFLLPSAKAQTFYINLFKHLLKSPLYYFTQKSAKVYSPLC
jgi:hypothetical protein